jgi:amino acid adenylation domain-containing protein
VSGDDAAYVMYTSASTGEAKGVVVTHRSVINLLATMARRLQPKPDEAWLAVTTISFDISVLEVFLPLVSGFRLVVATEEDCGDGRLLASAIDREGITFLQATPAGWRLLLESGWQGNTRLTMLCGGEALPGEPARVLVENGRALWNVYGPTETTIWSTAGLVTSESVADRSVVSIGRPIGNTQVYVLDENGHVLPPGVPGELYIGGAGLARGYHRDEATTRDRFLPNPLGGPSPRLYRTGDLARWLPGGTLEFLGRLDHQVKIRGFRIELGEIETWLVRHSGISEAVAAVRAAANGEQTLVAYFVPQHGADPDVADLRRHLAAHLPDYMTPDSLVRLDRLPRTPNGKIDRRALPAPVSSPAALDSPLSATEAVIVDALKELLQLPRVGADDDFLALGGNSLLAARLSARLSSTFGVNVTLRALLGHRTLRSMASLVDSMKWAAANGPAGASGEQVEMTL